MTVVKKCLDPSVTSLPNYDENVTDGYRLLLLLISLSASEANQLHNFGLSSSKTLHTGFSLGGGHTDRPHLLVQLVKYTNNNIKTKQEV